MPNNILKEKVEKEIEKICTQLNKIDESHTETERSLGSVFVPESAISQAFDVVNRVVFQNDQNTLALILTSFETKMEQSQEENFVIKVNSCKSKIYGYFLHQASQFYAERGESSFKPEPTPRNYFSNFYGQKRD